MRFLDKLIHEFLFSDVVSAYKSLQNEKKALEIAVGTLSGNENTSSTAVSASEASESDAEVKNGFLNL